MGVVKTLKERELVHSVFWFDQHMVTERLILPTEPGGEGKGQYSLLAQWENTDCPARWLKQGLLET